MLTTVVGTVGMALVTRIIEPGTLRVGDARSFINFVSSSLGGARVVMVSHAR